MLNPVLLAMGLAVGTAANPIGTSEPAGSGSTTIVSAAPAAIGQAIDGVSDSVSAVSSTGLPTLSLGSILAVVATALLVFVSVGVVYLSSVEWRDRRRRGAPSSRS